MGAVDIVVACLERGDEEAWQAFIRRFQPLIAASVATVLRRSGMHTVAAVDDLVQDTYLRLCRDNFRVLRDFEARHEEAIFGYLKVIAMSVALDYTRSRSTQKRGGEVADDDLLDRTGTSATSIEDAAALGEIERFLEETESERDRTIFWLYYRQGYTARDIAALPGLGLTQKGVESCVYRLTQALRKRTASHDKLRRPKGKQDPTALGKME